MRLGSLFDGIAGFPFASEQLGIVPVWASEIESAPISIAKRHFPNMLHLGCINELNGAEVEPVDIMTGGSPCQDLSVAGKRAGLAGERSGLFDQQIRLIKEMRSVTSGVSPRYFVWENVPGAFSSNGGEDFRTVLEEFAKVADPHAAIPRPPSWDGWKSAGSVLGDSWSIAWRVLDAQYWGVPQRRRRIFLVADFGGHSAAEILFKREGLRGDFETSRESWQGTATNVEGSVGGAALLKIRSGCEGGGKGPLIQYDKSATLGCNNDQTLFAPTYCIPINTQSALSRFNEPDNSRTGIGIGQDGDPSPTLQEAHSHAVAVAMHQNADGEVRAGRVANTLNQNSNPSGRNAPLIAYCIQANTVDRADTAGANGKGVSEDVSHTLNTVDRHAVAFNNISHSAGKEGVGPVPTKVRHGGGDTIIAESNIAIRRLTPTECERLQGFPDNWTATGHDGQAISDTQRYKALGNSVAIPCVLFVLEGIKKATKPWNEKG